MDEEAPKFFRGHGRAAFRLAMLGAGLAVVALLIPRRDSPTGESLWDVARESTWQKLGDWPAAEASLRFLLLSCALFFLLLAARQVWTTWLLPRFFHWLLTGLAIAPIVAAVVSVYYLVKALF